LLHLLCKFTVNVDLLIVVLLHHLHHFLIDNFIDSRATNIKRRHHLLQNGRLPSASIRQLILQLLAIGRPHRLLGDLSHLHFLLLLLLLDLLLNLSFLALLIPVHFLLLELLFVEIVTRMLFLLFPRVNVVVPDDLIGGLTRFPGAWQRGFETFLRDVEQIAVMLHVHAEIARIVFNLFLCRFVVIWQFFFQDFETFCQQCFTCR
jgi:hypothetical protein